MKTTYLSSTNISNIAKKSLNHKGSEMVGQTCSTVRDKKGGWWEISPSLYIFKKALIISGETNLMMSTVLMIQRTV